LGSIGALQMKRYDLIIVGAGPAGLSAAIVAAECGLRVAVFDENRRPGGQLFKQIHKFFGSKEHKAKIRGYKIGVDLLKTASALGVEVVLDAVVIGLYLDKEIVVRRNAEIAHLKGDTVIVATGATENAVAFPGWTLPGVMGAGAAQTMMNLHDVLPGKRILMVGSGNVGLVVGFQLLQSGCAVAGIVDVAPKVGGYGVHAAKLARCGVPFYLSHTVVKAEGTDSVSGVTISRIDENYRPVAGTEKHFSVDTVCLAVGLSPMSQLLKMAGCKMEESPAKGGYVPVCDGYGQTSVSGVFAAGDVSGIEEASSAMIKGRMAGYAAACLLGFIDKSALETAAEEQEKALEALRQGMFAPQNKGKVITKTDEGISVSESLLKNGFLLEEEISRFPGASAFGGVHPVIECTQNIPCNPCQDVCPKHCIMVGANITALPYVDAQKQCSGCGLCVASCPGQAVFLVQDDYDSKSSAVTIPYEFLPVPVKGERGFALDRSGKAVCGAEVLAVRTSFAFDKTCLLTIKVPRDKRMTARFYSVAEVKKDGIEE
jgi:thioredoxin reductase/Pyruvate/2-oxoacid:ferredoxin oxidoreductase delta subunit